MKTTFERQIKKAMEEKKDVLGTKRTLASLKKKELKSVIVAESCPEPAKEEVRKSAASCGAEVELVKINGRQLGTVCRKPFSVTVLGLKK